MESELLGNNNRGWKKRESEKEKIKEYGMGSVAEV